MNKIIYLIFIVLIPAVFQTKADLIRPLETVIEGIRASKTGNEKKLKNIFNLKAMAKNGSNQYDLKGLNHLFEHIEISEIKFDVKSHSQNASVLTMIKPYKLVFEIKELYRENMAPSILYQVVAVYEPVKVSNDCVLPVAKSAYQNVKDQISRKILALSQNHESLSALKSANYHEFNVSWELNDASKPAGKRNFRRAKYGKDGYWFKLTFYRGLWQGAAKFTPISFGDLNVWFNYGHDGNNETIEEIYYILLEEQKLFSEKYQCRG